MLRSIVRLLVGTVTLTLLAGTVVPPLVVSAATAPTVAAIAAGAHHTCALLADRTVRCWGSNDDAQLGDGTTTDRLTPFTVIGIDTATAISAGADHTCALRADQTVWCWGSNGWGQVGDGTTEDKRTPVPVSGISTATAISAGAFHTCAVLADGTLRCWGYNDYGQLGDGTTTTRRTPVAVSGISTATAVRAGLQHSCTVLADHTVRCWGSNGSGQLGDGTTTSRLTPVEVSGLSAARISAGNFHTCALVADQTVRCWGMNALGQLGDNTTTNRHTPVEVSGLSTATAVSEGSADHTCAVLADQPIRCWGANADGQIGDGTTTNWNSPVAVDSISGATAISTGWFHTCAFLPNGTIRCWGDNTYGQLGDGTRTDRLTPGAAIFFATSTEAPLMVSARAGVNQAKVYWQPPASDGGSAVTSYTATSSPGGKTCTAGAGGRSCYVTTLTNGVSYTFTVTARNAGGVSPSSAASNAVTPAQDTATPVLVSTSATPTRISSFGGTVTVELRITDDLSGVKGLPTVLFENARGASVGFTPSIARISGDEYDGTYRASISIPPGTAVGSWSLLVYPIRDVAANQTSFVRKPGIVIGTPAVPTNVTTEVDGDRWVTISWDAPVDDGGNVITGYEITVSPGGQTYDTAATTHSISFLDWPESTPVTFTVRAVNAAGASEPSAPSEPLSIPAIPPTPPTGVSVTPGHETALVTWETPASNGGSPITGYAATASPGGKTCDTDTLSCMITGLTYGATYSITVTATSAAGASAPSSPVVKVTLPLTPFTDIAGSPFKPDIEWVYTEGITSGCTATAYCPDGYVTREQMASFLARALKLAGTAPDAFTDDEQSIHEPNINLVAKAGIATGCAPGKYCPTALVSREQMASFLARALKLAGTAPDAFTDDEQSIHEPNINLVAKAGVATGCGNNRYCPTANVTRGQMAAFLHRAFGP